MYVCGCHNHHIETVALVRTQYVLSTTCMTPTDHIIWPKRSDHATALFPTNVEISQELFMLMFRAMCYFRLHLCCAGAEMS